MIDFGEIVILGRHPEDRHGGDPARVQILGQPRRRQRFIDGVRGTGKQPDLLPGDDRHGPRLSEARDQSIPGILGFQNSGHRRPAIIGDTESRAPPRRTIPACADCGGKSRATRSKLYERSAKSLEVPGISV